MMPFLVTMVASMLDPIVLVGAVLAGVIPKTYPFVLLSALVWAILCLLLVTILAHDEQSHGPNGLRIAATIVGSLSVSLIAFLITRSIRGARSK